MPAATPYILADPNNLSVLLPGLRTLLSIVAEADPTLTPVDSVRLFRELTGREAAGEGDFASQIWQHLSEHQKEYLYNKLPELKKAELQEKGIAINADAYEINPYSAFIPSPRQRQNLAIPSHSYANFVRFVQRLPGPYILAELLARQRSLDPVTSAIRERTVHDENTKILRDTGKQVYWERDLQAGLYEELDEEARQDFLKTLPASLRNQTTTAQNLYLKPLKFATDRDIFVTEKEIPSFTPSGIDLRRMTDEFQIEDWIRADAYQSAPDANPPLPVPFTNTPIQNNNNATALPELPVDAMGPKKNVGVSVPRRATRAGASRSQSTSTPPTQQPVYAPTTAPQPSTQRTPPTQQPVYAPTTAPQPSIQQTPPKPPAQQGVNAPTVRQTVQGAAAEASTADTTATNDPNAQQPATNVPGDEEDDEDHGRNGTIAQVDHPRYTGQPGKEVEIEQGSRPSQEEWAEWPLFDQILDYQAGGRPPSCVRLSDWNIWQVADICHKDERVKNWPADFDRDGNVRRTRANYGHAAKLPDSDNVYRYLVFKTYYQLLGQEGQHSNLARLLGPIPSGKDARQPYFRYGSQCLAQTPTPPPTLNSIVPVRHPVQSGPPANQQSAQSPFVPPANQQSTPPLLGKPVMPKKRPNEDPELSYIAKRQRGDIDLGDDEEIEDSFAVMDRAEANLKATARAIQGTLTADEEIASRLKAQSNALKTYIDLGTKLLTYTNETARIVADRLTKHIPDLAQEGLTEDDAEHIQGIVDGFKPTGQWRQARVPGFEEKGASSRSSTQRGR